MVPVESDLAEPLNATTLVKALSSDDSASLFWRSNCPGYLERQFGKTDALYTGFAGIHFNIPSRLSGRAAHAFRRIRQTNMTKLHQPDFEAARRQFFRKAVDRASEVSVTTRIRLTKEPF